MDNKHNKVIVDANEQREVWQKPTLKVLASATTESAAKDNNSFESNTYTSVGS